MASGCGNNQTDFTMRVKVCLHIEVILQRQVESDSHCTRCFESGVNHHGVVGFCDVVFRWMDWNKTEISLIQGTSVSTQNHFFPNGQCFIEMLQKQPHSAQNDSLLRGFTPQNAFKRCCSLILWEGGGTVCGHLAQFHWNYFQTWTLVVYPYNLIVGSINSVFCCLRPPSHFSSFPHSHPKRNP